MLPIYIMYVLLLLIGLCHDMEKMFNSLWWGGKLTRSHDINWVKWDRLCTPKVVSGIRFRKLHEFNLTLLCKHGWKLMTDSSSLLAQIFWARYYPNSTFLNASLGTNPNYTWRSILTSKNLLWKHYRFHVGDGSSILVKIDPWLSNSILGLITSPLGAFHDNTRVNELMCPGELH